MSRVQGVEVSVHTNRALSLALNVPVLGKVGLALKGEVNKYSGNNNGGSRIGASVGGRDFEGWKYKDGSFKVADKNDASRWVKGFMWSDGSSKIEFSRMSSDRAGQITSALGATRSSSSTNRRSGDERLKYFEQTVREIQSKLKAVPKPATNTATQSNSQTTEAADTSTQSTSDTANATATSAAKQLEGFGAQVKALKAQVDKFKNQTTMQNIAPATRQVLQARFDAIMQALAKLQASIDKAIASWGGTPVSAPSIDSNANGTNTASTTPSGSGTATPAAQPSTAPAAAPTENKEPSAVKKVVEALPGGGIISAGLGLFGIKL